MKTPITRREFIAAPAATSIAIAHTEVRPARADDRAIAESLQKAGIEIKFDQGGFATSATCRGAFSPEDYRAIGRFRRLKTFSHSGASPLFHDADLAQ